MAAAVLVLAVLAIAAPAQDLDVVHDSGLEGLAERIRAAYPRLLEDTEHRLGVAYEHRLTVHVVRDHDEFNATVTALGAAPRPEHVAAVAFGFRDVIVLKSSAWRRAPGDEFEVIFQHEIVHVVLGALQREHTFLIPRWLDEGIAQWVTDRPFFGEPETLDRAVRNDRLLSFERLTREFPDHEGASALAYAQSLSLVRFISRRKAADERVRGNVRGLLRFMSRGASAEEAIFYVTGLELPELEDAWRDELRHRTPVSLRHLPEVLVSGAMVIAAMLAFAAHRMRRRRRMDELEEDDDAEDPSFPG